MEGVGEGEGETEKCGVGTGVSELGEEGRCGREGGIADGLLDELCGQLLLERCRVHIRALHTARMQLSFRLRHLRVTLRELQAQRLRQLRVEPNPLHAQDSFQISTRLPWLSLGCAAVIYLLALVRRAKYIYFLW